MSVRVVCELDVHTPGRVAQRLIGSPVLIDWLTALGIDPNRCVSFRVLAVGDGTVEATLYREGSDGSFLVNEAGDGLLTDVHQVPLTVPVPAEVLAVGGR